MNAYIKNMFSQDYMLRSIVVSGEVSNVKYHSSGHIYFTMKDKSGSLACVMFAGNARTMTFRMSEGMQIEATGTVNVYEKSGSYQLYAVSISMAGAGALYEKYEALKAELSELGMFDSMYKQKIPEYAMTIGIVTAPTGAAVQDIMQIAHRRNPYVQLVLYPALVQGDGAKESIVSGIRTLENYGVDVIIVGRGGGSIEDLWAFNEECVARAIFDCNTPIISAVGHETDTTIADYVADLRAPTPSAAAELAVFSFEEYENKLNELEYKFRTVVGRKISDNKSYIEQLALRLDSLSPKSQTRIKRMTYLNKVQQLDMIMNDKIETNKHQLLLYIERLKALSPLNKLRSGYAYVTDAGGHRVYDASQVRVDEDIKLRMINGQVTAKVTEVEIVSGETDV